MLWLLPSLALAQQLRYTISGKVLESGTRQPVAGATVRIENTVLGTPTDRDGNFTLTASLQPGTYTLSVSYIGFKRRLVRLTLGDNNQVKLEDILLEEDAARAEEVVVTGTSTLTSKKELGNAISTVTAREIQNGAAQQIDQALQGKIPGAMINQNSGNPGGSISIQLRGANTILGNTEPLYIIDGVIVNNDRNVLLNLGGYVQNRLVDLNPNDIERIEVVKGAAAAAIYGSRANNGVIQIFTKRGSAGEPKIEYSTRFNFDQVRKRLPINDYPFLDPVGTPNPRPTQRFDYQDFFFQNAYGTEQYLSVSGGSGNTNYFLSGSYLGNQGIIKGTAIQRTSVRGNFDQVLTSWARVSLNLNYNYTETQDKANNATSGNDGVLVGFVFGNTAIDPRPNALGEYPSTRSATGIALANPLEVIDRFRYTQATNRFVGSARLDIAPFDGFSADATFGYDTYTQNGTISIPPGNTSFDFRNGFQRFATQSVRQVNIDINARYFRELTEWLKSTTLVGGTMQYDETDILGSQTINTTPNVEIVGGGVTTVASETRDVARTIYGAFIQQTFGVADRFFLTGAIRMDASSVFGKDERFQFFPKVSASYVLSEEPFWKESEIAKTINNVKLRAALGFSGGLTVIGAFDRFTNYSPTTYDGKAAILPSALLGSPTIRPERQREVEVGIDATFLNDRIGIELTYYDKLLTDLLIRRNIAASTGFSQQLDNVGTVSNRGLEVLLRTTPVQTSDLRWDATINFFFNRNEVIDTKGGIIALGVYGFSSAINGYPLGVFYASAYKRDANGNIQFSPDGVPLRQLNPDGTVQNKVIGDPNPDWQATVINELSWREFSFRVQIDILQGRQVLNFTNRNGEQNQVLAGYRDVLEGKKPAGYYTNPRFAVEPENPGVFRIIEHWVEDGSYVKIREASLFYNFTNFFGIRSGQIGLIGRNLFSFDRYNGYDPELNAFARQGVPTGADDTETPIPRSLSIALRINF
ncbi:MAG: TonB-dependent receptor [Chloroherpetonaceae bacterium]|nr:TonB-dependent receptor [Chloroherpetonaceae bacterium]MDW8020741.1 TonB-dependent receptor [Chloroherpetonaceae bacterium]